MSNIKLYNLEHCIRSAGRSCSLLWFFSAASKVSATCDPDLQEMKHVDSDPTCKGMWNSFQRTEEPVCFSDPLVHVTHLKFLNCLWSSNIAWNWNQNLRGDFIQDTGRKCLIMPDAKPLCPNNLSYLKTGFLSTFLSQPSKIHRVKDCLPYKSFLLTQYYTIPFDSLLNH